MLNNSCQALIAIAHCHSLRVGHRDLRLRVHLNKDTETPLTIV